MNINVLASFKLEKVDPQYLQQIRRDVKTEVLPVLLLQLHSLIEEHVGTVCLQVQSILHYYLLHH